jgi:DNA-binding NarL/FixJ family response regulator
MELLPRRAGHHVVGSADDAEAGGALTLRRKPDVALVDLALPDMSGAQLTRSLLKEDPEELEDAIRTVAAGGDYIDPRLTPLLAKGGNGRTKTLSPRERVRNGMGSSARPRVRTPSRWRSKRRDLGLAIPLPGVRRSFDRHMSDPIWGEARR